MPLATDPRCCAYEETLVDRYALRAGVHYCTADDSTVFLDLPRHEYFAIDASQSRMFAHLISEAPTGPSSPVPVSNADNMDISRFAEYLLDRGVLVHCRTPTTVIPTPRPDLSHLLALERPPGATAPVRVRHVLTFMSAFAYVAMSLKVQRLEPVIDQLSKRKQALTAWRRDRDREAIEALVCTYEHIRLWFFTARESCLLDSLTLALFLLHNGICATFGMGIATKPFAAHAWVQLDNLVLNDSAERIQKFTPILTV
jgi:Transglutaminase-like superfamily